MQALRDNGITGITGIIHPDVNAAAAASPAPGCPASRTPRIQDTLADQSASATQAKPTRASVGTPNTTVCRAGSPPGKCFTYSALQAA